MTHARSFRQSATRVALATCAVLLVPLVAMQFSDEVNWAVFDFALAVAFLAGAGLLLELASRKPGSLILRAGGAAFGLAAIVLGEADDAPGLVLVGVLLIAATAATTLRASRLEEGRA